MQSATAKSVTALRSRLKAMVLKLDADVQKTSEKIGSKFSTLDADGDGLITADDIKVALQTRLNRTLEAGELEAIIKTFDVNKDGKIDLEEVRVSHGCSWMLMDADVC
jgi:Ca2+-binding EF-hand superfamily protein